MENVLNKGRPPLSVDMLKLPLARIDKLIPLGPTFLFDLVSKILGFNLKKVSLPEELTGKHKIPSYLLHEFHGIPNGYYSVYFSKGYGVGFNAMMLGEMVKIRKAMTTELADCNSVLDLGCGDGSSTKALCDEGIKDVWGIDPSPYLLAQAIQRSPSAKFVQGVAENTEFNNEIFDGINICWVLHEIPSDVCDLILKECHRILKPGGKLVIMEPSEHQFRKGFFQLFKDFGFRGLYFRFLASLAHEPYTQEWQEKEVKPWLENHGFKVVSNFVSMPEEMIVAQKA